MRLLTLNAMGGTVFAPLLEFLRKEAPTTDIFCFQEMLHSTSRVKENRGARMNLYDELAVMLPEFQKFFAAEQEGYDLEGPVDFAVTMGQATFVKKSIRVLSTEEVFVYRERNGATDIKTIPANVLVTRIMRGAKEFSIMNLHGLAHPPADLAKLEKTPHFLGHRDIPDRLAQSEKILRFMEKEWEAKILCGDFNLRPDTQSFAMLARDMRNLVEEFKTERTRSRLSKHFGKEDFDPIVDYILTSPDVAVERFEALDLNISDHLPLVLEFS